MPTELVPLDTYVAEARFALRDELGRSGLKEDVAQAMVDTWTRSWFKNIGLRVLYLAPRAWTDQWLPTTITPAPESFVRTLVGRIETLTPVEELDLLARIRANTPRRIAVDPASLGRFAEPRLRRALGQLIDPAEKDYAQVLLDRAHALP